MTDTYLRLVNRGLTQTLAARAGLPRPAILRRTDPDAVDLPLTVGPVLVLADDGAAPYAAPLTEAMAAWGVEVLLEAGSGTRLGAVVVVVTHVERVEELQGPALALGAALRSLLPSGRVVVVSRAAGPGDAPELAAARQAVDGFMRSVAKELRAGATGNRIVLGPGVDAGAPSVIGALRFLLSARSAFVSGQAVAVRDGAGGVPEDWTRPLEGRVAVVTGAARGIGAAIARALARDGARVVGVDVPSAGEGLAVVANDVRGLAVQVDITAPDAARRILDHVAGRYGTPGVWVHNAGILRDKLLANMTAEKWSAVLEVNLAAQLRVNAELLAAPGALGSAPRLISLASTSGIAGNRGQTNYAASKAGIIGMTRALAPLLAERAGTVNAVAPGFIETEMTARMPALVRQIGRRANTLRQGGLPVDVAEAIAFLASPQAGGINGQVLRVCGQNVVGR